MARAASIQGYKDIFILARQPPRPYVAGNPKQDIRRWPPPRSRPSPTMSSPTSASPISAAARSLIAETEMPGLMALRRGVRHDEAAEGRAHHRLAAHDHPDRGADRDADRARRRRALGDLQHLLDPGPRRRRHRRDRRAGVRDQGREPRRLLGLCRSHLRLGHRHRQHHPRRRRRRHHVRAVGRQAREAGAELSPSPRTRRRSSSSAR